jgi:murein DD-endopeptidase MepM/ murein hydrolase activator NlpD
LPFASAGVSLANGPHGDGLNGFGKAYSVDFAPKGGGDLTVRAAAAGTATKHGACAVDIDHHNGWSTRYQHLGKFTGTYPRTVKAGDVLGVTKANAKPGIATCNSNGFSHLHFGLLHNGSPVSISGLSIGGYTVHGVTGKPYLGTWTRNANGKTVVTVPSSGNVTCCITNDQTVSKAPPKFTAASPPSPANVLYAYSYKFAASGQPKPTFTKLSGAFPLGLVLSSSGVLSGTPRHVGTYMFRLKATNASGIAKTPTLTIKIAKGLVPLLGALTPPNASGPAGSGALIEVSGPPCPHPQGKNPFTFWTISVGLGRTASVAPQAAGTRTHDSFQVDPDWPVGAYTFNLACYVGNFTLGPVDFQPNPSWLLTGRFPPFTFNVT